MSETLLDFSSQVPASSVTAETGVTTTAQDGALRMEVTTGGAPRAVALLAPTGEWDVSAHRDVTVELRNAGAAETKVMLSVISRGAETWDNRNDVMTVLAPGETKAVKVLIVRLPLEKDSYVGRFFAGETGIPGGEYHSGMLGLPGGYCWHWNRIDPAHVTQIAVSLPFAQGGEVLDILRVSAEGEYQLPTEQELRSGFAPFIDEFGQYRYHEWPGKVHTVDDFLRTRTEEEADLATHPGPPDRDRYGGWTDGPQLEATGRFYTTKHEGKWWLVDPEGRLFWSHGPDCVHHTHASTRIAGREHWFTALPEEGSPRAKFYHDRDGKHRGYSFSSANLWRKYGADWETFATARVHQRLRSWGMNTIANWSNPDIYLLRRTPYVVEIHYASRGLEGNHKLPDPFDPKFPEAIRMELAYRAASQGDPWCLGYFVDNELAWQHDIAVAELVAQAPAEQPAKRALLQNLQAKYQTIEALNAAWETSYASWEAFLQSREAPDKTRAYDDLAAFFEALTAQYFRVCREEVKAADAQALYLGCRIHHPNPRVLRVGAQYCDVLSINCYRYDVNLMPLPEDIDCPVIIGEWHFGALDRGLLHPSLRHVGDQSERAALFQSYLRSALAYPLMVGAHWFQYGDQATTGRDDGENYQAGFIDTCDTPYPETVRACREVSYSMYDYRAGLVR